MKVAVIGGGGRVGCCAAYALQLDGIVSEIILFDEAESLVHGEALDLLHSSALLHDQRIYVGDMAMVATSDVIIITAGASRRADEPGQELIERNVSLFLSIISDLKETGLRDDTILLVASNPVDILTYLAVQRGGFLPKQVVGLGTLLDTARFCSLIADAVKAPPTQVKALILGEHGDAVVPIWSSATCNGFSLENHPDLSASTRTKLFERTRRSEAELIRLKGGAGSAVESSIESLAHAILLDRGACWAVASSIVTLVRAIVLDQRKMFPVSSFQSGAYGLNDLCISVPAVVGKGGILKHLELDLWPRELRGLKSSAKAIMEKIKRIKT